MDMEEHQAGAAPNSTRRTASTFAASLREKSTEALIQAIHSPGDEAYVLDRARVTLKLFYEPDMSDLDRAEMIEEFGRALRHKPRWSVAQAFDEWNATQRRRPAPGDLVDLANKAMSRVAAEISDRQKRALPPPQPRAEVSDEEWGRFREQAQSIVERAGFTVERAQRLRVAPLARTDEEAMQVHGSRPHWTETVAPESPEMEALRAARRKNPIMQAAMRDSAASRDGVA